MLHSIYTVLICNTKKEKIMTTTENQFVSDNSEQQTAGNNLSAEQNQGTVPLKNEPEATVNTAVSKAQTFTQEEIPLKFRNKDGSTNLKALVKSYKELEPLLNEKSNWTKEKESLTSQLSKLQNQDFNKKAGLSTHSLKFYEEALEKASDSKKAKSLIESLKLNPSEESVKELESLFPAETIRDVFSKSVEAEYLIKKQEYQAKLESEETAVEEYLTKAKETYKEALENPVTREIFNETFFRFGAGLDSEWFFGKLDELKKSFIEEYQKAQAIESEKASATNTASKISPKSGAKGGTPLLKRNALELSPQELDRMLDEYYSK